MIGQDRVPEAGDAARGGEREQDEGRALPAAPHRDGGYY